MTILTICTTDIAADRAGIDNKGSGSGLKLRGSSTSIQDFQSYVKAQFLDDDWHTPHPFTADPTPSPVSQRAKEQEFVEENAGFCVTAGGLCQGTYSCCSGLTCAQGSTHFKVCRR